MRWATLHGVSEVWRLPSGSCLPRVRMFVICSQNLQSFLLIIYGWHAELNTVNMQNMLHFILWWPIAAAASATCSPSSKLQTKNALNPAGESITGFNTSLIYDNECLIKLKLAVETSNFGENIAINQSINQFFNYRNVKTHFHMRKTQSSKMYVKSVNTYHYITF